MNLPPSSQAHKNKSIKIEKELDIINIKEL
jgi:hypothetical protein